MESKVRGGQVCAKEVPKNKKKMKKRTLLGAEIYFRIIVVTVNSDKK